jgi:hypothetical protein
MTEKLAELFDEDAPAPRAGTPSVRPARPRLH